MFVENLNRKMTQTMRVAIAKALALLPLAPYVKGVPEKWPVASGQEANYNFFKVRVVMK